jgi:hypothetical protein
MAIRRIRGTVSPMMAMSPAATAFCASTTAPVSRISAAFAQPRTCSRAGAGVGGSAAAKRRSIR